MKLLEGYYCRAWPLVIAVNTPGFASRQEMQTGHKPGTAGHPLPGVAVRIVDPENMTSLAANREGLVLVKGLGQTGHTSNAILDGWSVTGDIGVVDQDGFLRITSQPRRVDATTIRRKDLEEAFLA